KGYRVRCLVRCPQNLAHERSELVEIVEGDVFDLDSVHKAMKNVSVAFYLVHSLTASGDFESKDRTAANNFATAAKQSGIQKIVYLGGLGDSNDVLSPHLKSRQEVGEILRQSGVQVVEFRASIVIGSGSLSFEMIRALVERLPVMITPRWVSVLAQPISISDAMLFLERSIHTPIEGNRIFEIGGRDVMSYKGIMLEYARQRGLRRFMIPVPVLTPFLSSLWLGLVTPIFARIGRNMIDSIRHTTVVGDNFANDIFDIEPQGVSEAISSALQNEDCEIVQTRWSDSLSSSGYWTKKEKGHYGNRIVDTRTRNVNVAPDIAFRPIQKIGGERGWYSCNWIWIVRGWIDLIVGGVGLRRGRRDPNNIRVGDAIDWWRVERIEKGKLLRLKAEMKLPGRAWLQFETDPYQNGSTIRQTAIFDPLGLWGLIYWYVLYPVHYFVFTGMLRHIANEAESTESM
ncbi:MAG: SDR family oxidoreductase, partial [Anaerolineales bacterium]|nr:SDR family oxidoreductase [Anaerolineales bacterium]